MGGFLASQTDDGNEVREGRKERKKVIRLKLKHMTFVPCNYKVFIVMGFSYSSSIS